MLFRSGCTSDIFSVFKDDTLQGAMEAEYSKNDNSIPNESGVSEVVTEGELVEIDGDMPDTMGVEPEISEEETATAGILPPEDSLPEITNPYAGVKGIFVAIPFSVNEAVEKNVADVKAALVDWKREYIDYEWRENIQYRYQGSTLFMADDGRYIEVFFDEEGFCKSVNIFKEELMGEPSVVEPLMGDMP